MLPRPHRALCLALLPVLLGLLGGCGGDDSSTPTGDAGMGEDVMYDETYGATCLGPLSCDPQAQVETACTCIITPRMGDPYATRRTGCGDLLTTSSGSPRTHAKDFCDESGSGNPPDVSCFMPGMYRTAGTSQMVTFYGTVDVFGNGGDADGITVNVYAEGADGALGDMLGTATSDITDPCATTEDKIDHDVVTGTRKLGFFSIPNIPTDTPLIVETSGNADFWKPLYTYNIYVYDDQVVTDPPASGACSSTPTGARYLYDAKTLSRGDYNSIPLTAGLPSGITSGHGAVAGEIHDCGDTRLSYAQVYTNPAPVVLTYFNDNPDNPLPDMGRRDGTSVLGLYAALDIPPGPVDVAAVGRVNGQLVSLGWYRAKVFPDSVTVVTMRGLRPQQTTSQP